jgi:transposase-like protein
MMTDQMLAVALSHRLGLAVFSAASSEANDENQLPWVSFPRLRSYQAIWLYLWFTPSLRDVEDLLAERGVTQSY